MDEEIYEVLYEGPLSGIEHKGIRLARGEVVQLSRRQAELLANLHFEGITGLEDLQLHEASLDEEDAASPDPSNEEE